MKEVAKMEDQKNIKPGRSIVAIVVILIIFITGYLILMPGSVEYELSAQEMLDVTISREYEVYPEDVAYYTESEDESYFIVDVRDPHSYQNGHITTAENIPVHDFLEKENLKLFDRLQKDSVLVILYGKDQLDANGGWMLLRQLGYDNARVMLGGYNYYSTSSLDLYDLPEIPEYMVEEPMFDFAGMMEEMSGGDFSAQPSDQPEIIVPARKKKKSAVEGGC